MQSIKLSSWAQFLQSFDNLRSICYYPLNRVTERDVVTLSFLDFCSLVLTFETPGSMLSILTSSSATVISFQNIILRNYFLISVFSDSKSDLLFIVYQSSRAFLISVVPRCFLMSCARLFLEHSVWSLCWKDTPQIN